MTSNVEIKSAPLLYKTLHLRIWSLFFTEGEKLHETLHCHEVILLIC